MIEWDRILNILFVPGDERKGEPVNDRRFSYLMTKRVFVPLRLQGSNKYCGPCHYLVIYLQE